MGAVRAGILSVLACVAAYGCCEVGRLLLASVWRLAETPSLMGLLETASLALLAGVCGFALSVLAVLAAVEAAEGVGEEGEGKTTAFDGARGDPRPRGRRCGDRCSSLDGTPQRSGGLCPSASLGLGRAVRGGRPSRAPSSEGGSLIKG